MRLPTKTIAVFLIISLALVFIMGYIWGILKNSDYFKIRDILCKEGGAVEFSYLKGRNIFSVDLNNESRRLLDRYPDCSSIKLARLLPDKIYVDFLRRKPVAFVKLYRYFTVDQDGFLFCAPDQPQDSSLPVITGLETKIFGPKPGRKYNTREISLALYIIKEFNANRVLKRLVIKKIDMANFSNASIFLGRGSRDLEVRLGPDNIKDKISILAGVIIQASKDLGTLKYIDLRFKEPVIKFNSPSEALARETKRQGAH